MSERRDHERSAIGRVRARLKQDLGWLEGFPYSGAWWTLDGRRVALTGRHIQSALACVRWAQREHKTELRKLVGDADAWIHRHLTLIEAVKLALDGLPLMRAPLVQPHLWPSALGRRLRAVLEGPIGDIVAAIAWSMWTVPNELGRVLTWCAEHEVALLQWLAIDDRKTLPAIVRFARTIAGERRAEALLAWLADPRTAERPLERKKTVDLRPQLNALVDDLAELDPKSRRRGLALFDAIAPVCALDDCVAWWSRFEKATADFEELRRLRELPRAGAGLTAKIERAQKRITAARRQAPPELSAERLRTTTLALATADYEPLANAIVRALADWPTQWKHGDPRFLLAAYWTSLYRFPQQRGALIEIVKGVAAEVRRHGEAGLLPWESVAGADHARRAAGIDYDLFLLPPAKLQAFFEILSEQPGAVDERFAEHAILALDAVPRERVVPLLDAWRASGLWDDYLSAAAIALADVVTVDAPHDTARVLTALADVENVEQLKTWVGRYLPAAISRELILNGHIGTLLELATRLAFLKSSAIAAPPLPEGTRERDWINGYPRELRDALFELATRDPNAEETAQRVIGKRIPSTRDIARELARLDAMPQLNNAQRVRRDKLVHWRHEELSAARAANLAAKIRDAGRRRYLEVLRQRLDAAVARGLAKLAGAPIPDAWLANHALADALLAVAALPRESRTLAGTLLAKRRGAPPFDLREHPANARFITKMRKSGLELTPWLEPSAPVRMVAGDGAAVRVGITTEPFDALLMGAHFRTCLSPHAVNFFSAIVNACDINKRVVYVRSLDERVLGRCLIALADNGALLVFQTYAHERKLELDNVVRTFVNGLARSMKTVVAMHGHVATLTASRWYDDGAIDSVERHPELADGSSLRRDIGQSTPELAAERIASTLGPLNDINLPLVLTLPEVQRRAEIATHLVAHIHDRRLTAPTLVLLTRLLNRAGDAGAARPLADAIADNVLRIRRVEGYTSFPLLQTLASANPSLCLATLRSLDGKQSRVHAPSLLARGIALRRLGRTHQAADALRRALESMDDHEDLRGVAEAELALV